MAPSPQPKRQRLSTPSNNASSSLDQQLESVFSLSDPSASFELSLERSLESDKENLIHVALRLGSALVDAASRSDRELAAEHNSSVWPLPPEITVKVLSFLDTASLCDAASTCTTFSKCALDPLCYKDIDMTRNGHKVYDSEVSILIQRAGKNLKSLKLGMDSKMDSNGQLKRCLLTKSCLSPLSSDNGASGALLQKLCLQRIRKIDTKILISALSNCKALIDLEIVGIKRVTLGRTLKAVSEHCPLIERFCFDYTDFGNAQELELSDIKEFIKKCNMVSSFAIRGCILDDSVLHKIMKGLSKLKYANFYSSDRLNGYFLRKLGNNGDSGDSLETLILRDCASLDRIELAKFFNALAAGKWKSLRFLDLSPIRMGTQSLKSRPEISLIANFDDGYWNMGDEIAWRSDTSSSFASSTNSEASDEDTQTGDEIYSDSSDASIQTGDELYFGSYFDSSDGEVYYY